jgi:perosamine synthetase
VHWRPLHLHPYYQTTFGWREEHCPVATREWERLVSIPIFSGMTEAEIGRVSDVIRELCAVHARVPAAAQR